MEPWPLTPALIGRPNQAKVNSVAISIELPMLFATGQRLAWKACDRSAASRLSSGQPVSV